MKAEQVEVEKQQNLRKLQNLQKNCRSKRQYVINKKILVKSFYGEKQCIIKVNTLDVEVDGNENLKILLKKMVGEENEIEDEEEMNKSFTTFRGCNLIELVVSYIL